MNRGSTSLFARALALGKADLSRDFRGIRRHSVTRCAVPPKKHFGFLGSSAN
jgi:hypothetical protein